MKLRFQILIVSMALSLLSIPFFAGSLDDAAFLIFAQHPGTLMTCWTQYQGYGFMKFLGWLYPVLGHDYVDYRLVVMLIGFAAYGILAYISRRSALTVIALAGLLWMPWTFINLRYVRYDTIQLLILAINLLWLVNDRVKVPSWLAGFLIGVSPLISLSGVIGWIPGVICALRTRRQFKWMIGFQFGVILFVWFYPFAAFQNEIATYIHRWGMGWMREPGFMLLLHPGQLIADYWGAFGLSSFGNRLLALPLYILLVLEVLSSASYSPLARFALWYSLSHLLLSASRYQVLLDPLFIVAGLLAIENITLQDFTCGLLGIHFLAGLLVTAKITLWGLCNPAPRMFFESQQLTQRGLEQFQLDCQKRVGAPLGNFQGGLEK